MMNGHNGWMDGRMKETECSSCCVRQCRAEKEQINPIRDEAAMDAERPKG